MNERTRDIGATATPETLRPLMNCIVARLVTEKMTRGGLYLPEDQADKPVRAVVLGVGPGKRDDSGKLWPVNCAVGDKVLLRRFAGMELDSNGEHVIVVEDQHVLAVIEGGAVVL